MATATLLEKMRERKIIADYRSEHDLIRMSVLSLVTDLDDCEFAAIQIQDIIQNAS